MPRESERPTVYFGALADLAGLTEERPPATDTVPCGPPDVEDEDTGLIESELLERLRDASKRDGP